MFLFMCLTFQCNYYIISRGLNICKFESHIKTFEDDIVIILKYKAEEKKYLVVFFKYWTLTMHFFGILFISYFTRFTTFQIWWRVGYLSHHRHPPSDWVCCAVCVSFSGINNEKNGDVIPKLLGCLEVLFDFKWTWYLMNGQLYAMLIKELLQA